MILLTNSGTDKLQLTTSSTANVDVHASWADLLSGAVTPGRTNTTISSATTTDIVATPAASTQRTVKTLHIRNRHATTANTVTVLYNANGTTYQLFSLTLAAGETLHYDESAGWSVRSATSGAIRQFTGATSQAAVQAVNWVVLSSDVVNNNASANTIADVTGLSFSVTAGYTYWFRFVIPYDSAATTTGSRWSINGPGSPTMLNYTSRYTLTATSQTINSATAYDIPAASNATSLTTGNVAEIEGYIIPSSDGTVIARFASEVSSSAVTAKAGGLLQWARMV